MPRIQVKQESWRQAKLSHQAWQLKKAKLSEQAWQLEKAKAAAERMSRMSAEEK
jgi:hypothetical protein